MHFYAWKQNIARLSKVKQVPNIITDMSLHQEKIDILRAPNIGKLLEWLWSCQKLTYVKNDQKGS